MSPEYKEGRRKLSVIRIGMYPIWQVAASSQKECVWFSVFSAMLCSTRKGLFNDKLISGGESSHLSLNEGIYVGSNVQSTYISIAIFWSKTDFPKSK